MKTRSPWMMCRITATAALLAPGELPGLALGGDGRGDDHLHGMHLADGADAERGHRLTQRADEVLGAMHRLGRAEQDLLQRQPLADLDSRAAWERRRWGGHAPVEATAGSLERTGEGR